MEIYTMVSSGSFVYKKAHFPDLFFVWEKGTL